VGAVAGLLAYLHAAVIHVLERLGGVLPFVAAQVEIESKTSEQFIM
jgi:hypothetical protein